MQENLILLKTCLDEFKKKKRKVIKSFMEHSVCHAKNTNCIFMPRTGQRGRSLQGFLSKCFTAKNVCHKHENGIISHP